MCCCGAAAAATCRPQSLPYCNNFACHWTFFGNSLVPYGRMDGGMGEEAGGSAKSRSHCDIYDLQLYFGDPRVPVIHSSGAIRVSKFAQECSRFLTRFRGSGPRAALVLKLCHWLYVNHEIIAQIERRMNLWNRGKVRNAHLSVELMDLLLLVNDQSCTLGENDATVGL